MPNRRICLRTVRAQHEPEKISSRSNASNQERLMQEMEPQRRPEMNARRRDLRPLRGDELYLGGSVVRRNRVRPNHGMWSSDLQLGAGHIRAEALTFVALAVRRSVQDETLVVVVAAFAVAANTECVGRNFRRFSLQAMAGPMATPAGNGLRQHENRHQLGNKCLHNDPGILPNHYGHRQSRQRGLRKSRRANA